MKYDKELTIATGNSRKQKVWKNKKLMWSELVDQLRETTRTPETVAEYANMPKSQQDDIKDNGGFVGGYLVKGSRINVKYRDVIALDIDYDGSDIWDNWQLFYGNASCIYSTHKHTETTPRLRLILPLNRKVTPDEYQAIGRKIAWDMGIDCFDDTTYQPQRLMYWPSTSKDGDYFFDCIDDDFLDVDKVLATYDDWTDITTWPVSSRANDVMLKAIKKQQDPFEKPGVIGAFCRAYDIHEAIKKFIDDYETCAIDNRYTYVKGSTSAGIITYDDKFSYSHHATDPASGLLCNAFDLVRLHKFKDLDEDSKVDTPANRLPSFKAMEDLATKDKKVKKEIVESKQQLLNEFDDESDFEERLQVTKKGVILANYFNIELILDNDPYFKGRFGYDEFAHREVAICDLPWREVSATDNALNDGDDANIRAYFDKKYGITGKDKIFDSVQIVCRKNSFHPVKNYLESLIWDGVKRIDTLMIDYFACVDSEYVRAVTRKTLLAAVTRIYEPGCKFDTMLTLKGNQGCGKSSFFQKLAKSWFTDSIKDIRHKDAMEALQGVWIVEMGELTAMKKADAETIKSFISGTVDRFRMAYGRRTANYPRQGIIVATTNETEFLRDKTGNRRFWIVGSRKGVTTSKKVFSLTSEDFNQFWAEAKALYDDGTEDLILSKELELQAITEQKYYMVEDPKELIIMDYLERLLPENWNDMDVYDRQKFLDSEEVGTVERTRVCAAEIWCEALGNSNTNKLDQYQTLEINRILDNLNDWEKQKSPMRFKLYGPKRGYKRV